MAGGTQNDDDEPITSINIIPLVDIVLVVLIIFMVTASYIVTPAIEVELPKAKTGEPKANTILALVITREGDLFLNNKKIDDAMAKNPKLTAAQMDEVKKYRTEGEALHKAGKHQESVDTLAKAMKILDVK